MSEKVCSLKGCGKTLLAKGYCKPHYDRWRRHGDPTVCLKPMVQRGLPMRWLRDHAADSDDVCLAWPFARFPDGRAHMKGARPSRIMCELAHGPAPTPKHEAAHSCGKAHEACVHPKHLRWATKAENEADKVAHGTIAQGERLPQAKLSDADVRSIRALKGAVEQQDIARMYGVAESCVSKIINRRSWRHVA